MAGIKYFVHGSGTWRELDINSGSVNGWGKIQFVYVRRGRLVVARRNCVLKGLKALVAGKPTTVRDGHQLTQIRRKKKSKTKQINEPGNESGKNIQNCQNCSCQHNCNTRIQNNQSISNKLIDELLKPSTNSTATQCVLDPNNSTQDSHDSDTCRNRYKELEKIKPIERTAQRKSSEERPVLIVTDEDLLLVRRFIEQDDRNVFNISLYNFDADDNCKREMLYMINPLVKVNRSRRIAEMYRAQSQCSRVTLDEFITNLGLQNVNEVTKKSKYKMRARNSQASQNNNLNDSDTEKENISKKEKRANNIDKSSKNKSYLQLKGYSDKREKKIDKRKYSSDGEYFKLSFDRDLLFKRSPAKFPNHSINVTREVSRLKSKSSDAMPRKLRLVKDGGAKGNKTKECGENKPKQKLLEQSLKDRKHKNNKTFNNKQLSVNHTAEVNKGQSYSKKVKRIADISIATSSEDSLFYEDKATKKPKNEKTIVVANQQPENNKNLNKETPENNTSKTKRNASRPYSRAEDEGIVSWLRVGERATLVNGNRVWKELQPIHRGTTGCNRPWQSLRNRYLRYILPALADLAVPPSAAQRLRAAAAQGELKRKTNPATGNSIFKDTSVRSAWALRPRCPLRSPPAPLTSATPVFVPNPPTASSAGVASTSNAAQTATKTRHYSGSDTSGKNRSLSTVTLRSSAAHSPLLPTPERKIKRKSSITYSELTRRFASRHKSTPQSQTSASPSTSNNGQENQPRQVNAGSDTSVGRLNGNTKRQRSQSDSSTSSSDAIGRRRSKRFIKTPDQPRSRRLYNPPVV